MKKYKYIIGIDSGTNTGFAIWDTKDKRFDRLETVKVHAAILQIAALDKEQLSDTLIRVEDARLRKWFGNSGKEKLQGAGSIKRDAVIWEDFLKDINANYQMVAPKNNLTKLTEVSFKNLTKWAGETNYHSRDAGMLC